MGWQGVSKGIIVGVLFGLFIGFPGGYYFKALNAEAPISNTSSNTSDTTDPNSDSLGLQIWQSIQKNAAQYAHSKATASGSGLLPLLRGIVPTANAQADAICSSTGFDIGKSLLDQWIRDALRSYEGSCLEVVYNIKNIKIETVETDTQFRIRISGNGSITIRWYEKDCKLKMIQIELPNNNPIIVIDKSCLNLSNKFTDCVKFEPPGNGLGIGKKGHDLKCITLDFGKFITDRVGDIKVCPRCTEVSQT